MVELCLRNIRPDCY